MCKKIFFGLFILLAVEAVAQNAKLQFRDIPMQQTLEKKNPQTQHLNIGFPEVSFQQVETNRGNFSQLEIPGTYRSGAVGEPQLVSFNKLLIVPVDAEISVSVISYQSNEFDLDPLTKTSRLLPYQPSYRKNENPDEKELLINEKTYAKTSFIEQELVTINYLGKMRGLRLAQLTVNPVQYNPGKNKLRVHNQIVIELTTKNGNVLADEQLLKTTQSPYFEALYQQAGLEPVTKSLPLTMEHPVSYLVVTPPEFLPGLVPFIEWKTQKGFEMIIGNTAEIGSSVSEIKTWIQMQYADTLNGKPAPTFLLLVGDVAQIPASQNGIQTSKATDLYYASVDGDMFPEMFYGRFSAQDTAQLRVMIDKTLMYEKYQFADDSYLNQATLIAGADATWNPRVAQPTINYSTENYFNAAQGFDKVNAYLTNYTGCYNTEQIGVGILNYTAHCSQMSWSSPYLSATTVQNFTNSGKYPIAIGNCCTSGDFSISTCIGEAFLRAPLGGAVAYLGSVPDTFWWEDYYWAVGAHYPVYNQYPSVDSSGTGIYDALFMPNYQSLDAIVFAGNLAVTEAINQAYPTDVGSLYYWEAYHCLGDPSLQPYLTQGKVSTVEHAANLNLGSGELEVLANPGALLALSNNTQLISSGFVDSSGVLNLSYTNLQAGDSLLLVVTQAGYKPYFANIVVLTPADYYPDVSIWVQQNQISLANAEVTLEQSNLTTDGTGLVEFADVDTGWVHLEVRHPDFITYSDSFYLGFSDTLLTINLKSLPDLRFVVFDSIGFAANVAVSLDSLTQFTDALGQVVFSGVEPGIHLYRIEKAGYYVVQEQLMVPDSSVEKPVFLREIPDLQFTVMFQNQPVSDAKIIVNQSEYFTDVLGRLLLEDIGTGTFAYEITKEAYSPLNGSVTVFLKNESVKVELPRLSQAQFTVRFADSPVSDVQITLDTMKRLTDSQGIASFPALIYGDYPFTVKKDKFQPVSDTLQLAEVFFTKDIELELETFTAYFYLTANSQPMAGARILLNTTEVFSDDAGSVVFDKLFPDSLYFYLVSCPGYESLSGSFTMGNFDLITYLSLDLTTYQVNFVVSDEQGLLPGALIDFANQQKQTNSFGEALFSEVLPAESLVYTIQKDESHLADTGTIHLKSDTTVAVLLSVLEINEESNSSPELFPNPTSGKLTLQWKSAPNSFSVKVYSNLGVLLKSVDGINYQLELDLTEFDAGVYHLQIQSGSYKTVKRILLK
ncbi:MAG: C25 family cysteine peptidase [Salinivirgaceae bacterium]